MAGTDCFLIGATLEKEWQCEWSEGSTLAKAAALAAAAVRALPLCEPVEVASPSERRDVALVLTHPRFHRLEQRVINALHQEHPVETLRAWIGGEGMPAGLLEDLVSSLQPDDDTGYLSAGHISPGVAMIQLAWEDLGQFWPALEELVASLAGRRGCQGIAYELTYPVRALLIAHFALRQAWYEANPLFLVDQNAEIEGVEQAVRHLSTPNERGEARHPSA